MVLLLTNSNTPVYSELGQHTIHTVKFAPRLQWGLPAWLRILLGVASKPDAKLGILYNYTLCTHKTNLYN